MKVRYINRERECVYVCVYCMMALQIVYINTHIHANFISSWTKLFLLQLLLVLLFLVGDPILIFNVFLSFLFLRPRYDFRFLWPLKICYYFHNRMPCINMIHNKSTKWMMLQNERSNVYYIKYIVINWDSELPNRSMSHSDTY